MIYLSIFYINKKPNFLGFLGFLVFLVKNKRGENVFFLLSHQE